MRGGGSQNITSSLTLHSPLQIPFLYSWDILLGSEATHEGSAPLVNPPLLASLENLTHQVLFQTLPVWAP